MSRRGPSVPALLRGLPPGVLPGDDPDEVEQFIDTMNMMMRARYGDGDGDGDDLIHPYHLDDYTNEHLDDDDTDGDDEYEYDSDDDDDYALHDRGDELYKHGPFRAYDPIPHQEPEHLTVDQVRARAEPLNKRLWENHTHLQAISQRYEAVIQRRWDKKSKVKRREAVVNAWGSDSALPKDHRPDLLHIRSRLSQSVESPPPPPASSFGR